MSRKNEEYSVECDNKKSILEEIESAFQLKLISDPNPYIISIDSDISKTSILRALKYDENINKRVIADYEINSNYDDFRPEIKMPLYFSKARENFFNEIYTTTDYRSIKVSIDLTIDNIKSLLVEYINSFLRWLEEDDTNPFWIDLFILCESDKSNNTIKIPSAIIMPPYHPLKLIQLCETQNIIVEVLKNRMGCPGAGLIDLTTSPSNIKLKYGQSGINNYKFYTIPQNDNYYTFLLSKEKFDSNDFIKKYYEIFKNEELFKMKFFDINVGIESKFWNTNYQGEYGKIIYGHTPIIQNKPVYFQNSICIDNGCVFGGWLSALIIDTNLKISFKSIRFLK